MSPRNDDMNLDVGLLPGMPTLGLNGTDVMRMTIPAADPAPKGRLRTVPVDAIEPNGNQPRRIFDEDALAALAASIVERGVLQPPVVRVVRGGGYELVAGERRLRAAKLAKLTEIEVLVGDQDDDGSLLDALMENVAREDLTPVEAARAYAACMSRLGLTQKQLAERIGKNRVTIADHVRMLDLPDVALKFIEAGRLTYAHGLALLRCEDHDKRKRLARRAVEERWTTRELKAEAISANGAPRAVAPDDDQQGGLSSAADQPPASPASPAPTDASKATPSIATPSSVATVAPRVCDGAVDSAWYTEHMGDVLSAATGLEVVVEIDEKDRMVFIATDAVAGREFALRVEGVTAAALDRSA